MAGAHRLADRGSALIRGERRRDRRDAEDPPEREREPTDPGHARRPLALKLPAEVKAGPEGIDPTDPKTLTRVLADVQRTLPSLLIERKAAA